jgi:hypothetical protein
MLVEHDKLGTTFENKVVITEGAEVANDAQYWSHRVVSEQWRLNGPTLDFKDAMIVLN